MSLRAYRHINRLDGLRPGLLPGILAAFICGLAPVVVAEEPAGAEDQAPTPSEMPAANPVVPPELPASGQSEPEPTETAADKHRRLAQERFLLHQ